MKPDIADSFGLLIAYLLPGFVTLWAARTFVPGAGAWLDVVTSDQATIGGFLYSTLASLTVGMTLSAVRWLVVDAVHHRTGIAQPRWDFSRLGDAVEAFSALIAAHYHYYKFYANMLVAVTVCYVLWRGPDPWRPIGWPDAAFTILTLLFFLASRDALKKYYARTGQLLASPIRAASVGRAKKNRS